MSLLRDRLRAEDPAVGLWTSIPHPLTAEAAAGSGADYVVVDQQHGVVAPGSMLGMLHAIEAAGAYPLVRVGREDPWTIGHALDLGAQGVIVPMVQDADQAARAVAACRYAPEGVRSWGAVRGGSGADPVCLVMVETRKALENVEAIAATPDLDGIYVGPSDLALSLGLQPTLRLEHPPVLDALERVRAACAGAGIVAGVHCLVPEDAADQAAAGFAMVTAGGDLSHLREALGAAVARVRER